MLVHDLLLWIRALSQSGERLPEEDIRPHMARWHRVRAGNSGARSVRAGSHIGSWSS